MPKNLRKSGSRKNRRISKPNVFAQSQASHDDVDDDSVPDDASPTQTSAAPRTRARVERTTRRAGLRSEIYTRSLPAELRKMGVLSAAVVVALLVLTFTL
ncbi:MAG: hypothetical protein V3T49_08085 [Dehalococcoidia bacterium]